MNKDKKMYNYDDLMYFLVQLCSAAGQLDPNDHELCDRYAQKVRDLIDDLSWFVPTELTR